MSSIYVVAAMTGCWYRESGVNPGIWESLIPCAWNYQYEYTGKGGYGLGQWTNVGSSHGRLWGLHQFVTSHGYGDGSGPGEIAYIPVEAYWNGVLGGTTDNRQTRGHYGGLANFLNSSSTNLDDLVWDFLANWEGVPGNAYNIRKSRAYTFLKFLQQHGSEPGQWTSRNKYITEAQTRQNVLACWHALQGDTPAPDPPQEGEHFIQVQSSGQGEAYADQQWAAEGETITLTADAYPGYEFLGFNVLTDNTQIINNNQFIMPDDDVSIEARFSGTITRQVLRSPWIYYQWDRLRRRDERK